jgi:hypothetical protein
MMVASAMEIGYHASQRDTMLHSNTKRLSLVGFSDWLPLVSTRPTDPQDPEAIRTAQSPPA